jgi:Na+-transporting NADH:ubiquinone oxidoreductase subunit A
MLEDVMYCSPVSGEVAEIKRGAKRKILEIKILADKKVEFVEFKKFTVSDVTKITRDESQELLTKSGIWPNIIQRPFGIVANPADSPKSIFISSFDTHPLAPDYDFLFNGQENFFQIGIEVLKKFTSGKVHLGLNGNDEVSKVFAHTKDVEVHKLSGKHPVGNVGTLIHHIDPINKGDIVWTINPYGVIQIGKLFLEGKYDAEKTIALTGSEVKHPQYYKTFSGACINKLIDNNLNSDHVRFISGNVLTGQRIASDGYLGFYDQQVTVIPEGDYHEMFGWVLPTFKKLSFHRALGLLSFLTPNKEYALDTNTNGEERAFVLSGQFEKVTPLDILPTYLIKAILAEDYDEMEELGIYEVIEEDLALCEFIDVSKNEIQKILREGIDLIKNS